ncbi:MAG: putative cytosol aminopeptidase [Candidatus Nomurabacteria bacterium GW2011_GWE1_32_28]|uniref:Probable cytosol aminopeptidase n=1 Tax=Candidatus Nomurabacteria bacterium GW2011_GWF1_31_48 TaxID=1618767 RepID=A0A0G0AVM8_9BACT|nr:MAG: putative cytosol aminopeptidase [Candidatus Nomurabacteria bacterium GW2011_GWF2_30_133]KKP28952.1 MAG: putative cytosol aminopeptidase [Candidatus Nomurabacteria bacterium GW2011_GWE2_31_40]KKP30690.1 MAG: putative cytosol aminopeptidase [Candidatus Nomurabacteria bacterium GW2011_GWF1_31_48]KKP35208.1 MAG: putative cytosol aminopeptidase [Candidatus Nomurabacteria bacterium GW2011_GWE1_32_28]HAS80518.1 leucyl aminopeptidase [Candidatus Nomurabacteria bacterium]
MKITFKQKNNDIKGDVLFVSIDSKNKDETIKENGKKTLYLKCDELEKMNLRKLFLLVRKMIIMAKSSKAEKVAFDFNDFKFKNIELTDVELAEIIGTQLDFANYEFVKYKTPTKEEFGFIKEIIILGTNKEIEKAILKGHIITDEVNKTRSLSNTPGGDMTPHILAKCAKDAVKGLPVKVIVLGEKEMEKQKMQAILSVGRGSDEESKFIIMEYMAGKKGEKPIVLVGKGVTFDSGGLNLKPSGSMTGMNMDMSGGAAVIHVLTLAAKMKLRKNIIALIPSVENFVSGKSYRPGDVIRSMSGQTIEILNTDAEGRVILADALTYSQKYNPEVVIDVATLTGAACVALGERASAIFTNDDELSKTLEKIGEQTGDYVWRLPMWEEYENEIKGILGDWTNIHNKDSRYGGATYGAIFLYQFIKGYKWAHIDMAPRMTSMTGEYLAPGALGTPVRLLYKFIEGYKN